MIKHLFISFELALIAKEKGYDEPSLGYYHYDKNGKLPAEFNHCLPKRDFFYPNYKNSEFPKPEETNAPMVSAPLYQQMIDWFRNNHNIHIEIYEGHDEDKIWWNAELKKIELGYNYEPINKEDIVEDSYYETLSKAIEEAFKLI